MIFSKESVRSAFSNSAHSYNEAAVLQKEVLSRLINKLNVLQPEAIELLLDVGSGTGLACKKLAALYGVESYYAYDFALPMLKSAEKQNSQINQHAVCGDVVSLPYMNSTFDVVFSASTYQWCNDLGHAFSDSHQILKEGGLYIFSTFGPDTLKELRHCFAKVDNEPHVSPFIDMQELGDGLLSTGFYAPVIESEIITVEYSSPLQLLKDLQATGATNHMEQRSRGLMGKDRLKKMLAEYEKLALENGKYPASYEVIYAHGWKKSVKEAGQIGAQEWQKIEFK